MQNINKKEYFYTLLMVSIVLSFIISVKSITDFAYHIDKIRMHGEYQTNQVVLEKYNIGLIFDSYFPLFLFIIVSIVINIAFLKMKKVPLVHLITLCGLYFVDFLGWIGAIHHSARVSSVFTYMPIYFFGILYSLLVISFPILTYRKYRNNPT